MDELIEPGKDVRLIYLWKQHKTKSTKFYKKQLP